MMAQTCAISHPREKTSFQIGLVERVGRWI
jgi:hypothetical protein